MSVRTSAIGVASLLLALPGCSLLDPKGAPAPEANSAASPGGKAAAPAEIGVSFTKSIKPMLSNQCTICHNTQVLPKRPNFETREGAMRSGVIVPGKPDASRILTVVQEAQGADKAMPPVSHQLTTSQVALLRQWIAEGAPWPSGEAGRVKPAFIPQE